MKLPQRLRSEIRSIAIATLFFAAWFMVLILIKSLILAEYQIHFRGVSAALVGALIVAKVVVLTEHLSLGTWVTTQPRAIDVLLRTALHICGVVIVLLAEKAFKSRKEYDGFISAFVYVVKHRDIYHVWATAIAVSGALLTFNTLIILGDYLKQHNLSWSKAFLSRPSPDSV